MATSVGMIYRKRANLKMTFEERGTNISRCRRSGGYNDHDSGDDHDNGDGGGSGDDGNSGDDDGCGGS